MKNLLYILSILSLLSCSDFLQEYSQDKDYVRSWKDLNELLIGDCYYPVNTFNENNMLSNPGAFIHVLADEVDECQLTSYQVNGDARNKAFGYFTWQQRVGQNESYTDYYAENEAWTTIYKKINVANNIIASIEGVPCNSEEDRQGIHKVKGETHFLRALYYFWLANVYAKPYNPATSSTDLCVPIKTSDVVEDIKFTRNTVEEVYQLVLDDLREAEKNLTLYKKSMPSIYRADSTACHLLQSRVYLYMQNWKKASEYAKKVIDAHPALMDLNAATGKFSVKSNEENIFSMGGNTVYGMFCNCGQAFSVSNDLYNSYSENDMRKKTWFWKRGVFTGLIKVPAINNHTSYTPNAELYYFYRYLSINYKLDVSDLFLFRSSEAYLNYAEAEAYMGNENESTEAINLLRKNRISANVKQTITASGDELIKAIRKERRLELAFEGHRWFDLRRYSVCSVMPESKSITHDWTYFTEHTGGKATARHRFVLEEYDEAYTLPIPYEVISFNTGMENNQRTWREYNSVEF